MYYQIKTYMLYHLSRENCDGQTFKPRVPSSAMDGGLEDTTTPRVCFSTQISGAFRGCPVGFTEDCPWEPRYTKMFVHVPVDFKAADIVFPDKTAVPDVEATDEVWLTAPVKLRCIGQIYVGRDRWKYPNEPSIIEKPKVHYKWLRKFNWA